MQDPLAAHLGQWVMPEDEARQIAKPAARIIARHTPESVAGIASPDAGDALAILVAVAAYASRQIQIWTQVRRTRREVAATAQGIDLGEHEDSPEVTGV